MNRQTHRKGQERERQSQLAEDTKQEDWCRGQELPPAATEGKQERKAGQKKGQRVVELQSPHVLQRQCWPQAGHPQGRLRATPYLGPQTIPVQDGVLHEVIGLGL